MFQIVRNNRSPLPLLNMSSPIQIIDEHQAFSEALPDFIHSLPQDGLNYHVISVFGSQSTGKSTLLNSLFATQFGVMDGARRQQTTKGIWLARAGGEGPSTLVMDVEGTDGRERGEDQDFERRAALFALATSEVLIVNLWENQVGLYQGANMGLLKTVFEVNLSLFSKQPHKCLLLFVIRDHLGTTPLSSLALVLSEDMEKIWSQISKPPGLENALILEYFDLAFEALPHKVLSPEKFSAQVDTLRSDLSKSYFNQKYHKNVPIDGWPVYAANVWKQIVMNKELDLPTQQVLVSRFRCDEIVLEAVELFHKQYAITFESNVEIVENIALVFAVLKKEPLELYDSLASRYTKSVYTDRREVLIEKMDSELRDVYKTHLRNVKAKSLALFSSVFLSQKKNGNAFPVASQAAVEASVALFTENLIEDDPAYNASLEHSELEKLLTELVKLQQNKEVKLLLSRFTKRFSIQLKEKIVFLLKNPNPTVWDDAQATFESLLEKLLAEYKKGDTLDFGLGLPALENEYLLYKLQNTSWKVFKDIVHNHLTEDNVVAVLRDVFEDNFRYDPEGVPIVWKNATEIDIQYKKARAAALALLPILSEAKASSGELIEPKLPAVASTEVDEEEADEEDDDDVSFSRILSDIQQAGVSQKLKKQIDVLYIDAKRSTIQLITTIPYWIYIIIVVLGWNEFMAVLRNPLYFTFLALLLVSAYFVHQLGLWGPIQLVVGNTFNETLKEGKRKLRDILSDDKNPSTSVTETTGEDPVVENIPLDDL